MALLTGKRIGEFEVDSVIGIGGFSTVYLAYDRLGNDVAVKVLAENHAFDANIRERFISEADALRRIESDLIIDVFDLGETSGGQPYIVMQNADRGDLVHRRRTLINKGWKPLAVDMQFLVDVITDALAAVHEENLVHRDVSPSNILIRSGQQQLSRGAVPFLRSDESILLADFGLVKDMSIGSGLTRGAGTPGFAAPEQRTGLTMIDHRIDVYGASAVVLWFLTGATAPTLPDWRERLTELEVPESLLIALGRGLSARPEDRHESIAEWHLDITANLMFLDNSEPGEGVAIDDEVPAGTPSPRTSDGSTPSTSTFSMIDSMMTQPKVLGIVAAILILLTIGVTGRGTIGAAFSGDPDQQVETGSEATDETFIAVSTTDTTLPSTTATSALTVTTSGSTSTETTGEQPSSTLLPPPELAEAFFTIDQGRETILLRWVTDEIPENVVGREVQIATNAGQFQTELLEDNPSAAGQKFFQAGPDVDKELISRTNDYRVRLRWVTTTGDTSKWGPVRTIRAES